MYASALFIYKAADVLSAIVTDSTYHHVATFREIPLWSCAIALLLLWCLSTISIFAKSLFEKKANHMSP